MINGPTPYTMKLEIGIKSGVFKNQIAPSTNMNESK